jgi:hypothetical protein
MMIIINRIGNELTGSYNGKPFGVSFSDEKYAAMKEIADQANKASTIEELKPLIESFESLTHESYKELIETASEFIYVNKHTNKFYLKINNVVSSQPLPKAFVDRILTSVEKKIDVKPLVYAFTRFLRPIEGRPAYTPQRGADFAAYLDADFTNEKFAAELVEKHGLSQEVARARATTKQVSITQEGLLVCYKVSKEILKRYELNEEEDVVQKSRYKKSVDPDTGLVTYAEPEFIEDRLFEPVVMGQGGDAFMSGDKEGHFVRVGHSHYLKSWSQVGNPGHKGLHVGGLDYIRNYQTDGTVTHNVFVDPMDIYGIATGYSDGAMTVRRYFVFSSFAGPNRSIYHSSTYAAMTDKEFRELLETTIKATGVQKKAELDQSIEEAYALV